MQNFEFENPVKLLFGKGQIANIKNEIPKNAKVLLTYGGGSIKRNGIYNQIIEALKGYNLIEFSGIEANPDYNTLLKAIKICKTEHIDFLLAAGGGSIVDGTKFIAAGALYEGDPWDFVNGVQMIKALPLGNIMTMPATSSEMNCTGVISRRDKKLKFAFSNPIVYPKFAVLDPTAVFTIPKRQIGNGIVDIFIHIMEQYLTTTENYMVTDKFSEGIIKNLIELAPALMKEGTPSYEDAANYMLTATMGLNGWVSMGAIQDWASHMIGHELTALEGLAHGETLAIIFPGTMNIMREEKKDKILQFAKNIWNITEGNDEDIINQAIANTEKFFISVGKKVRLSDYNIGQDTIDEIVHRFETRKMNIGENGIVTPAHVRRILEDRR
ncbi:MAG: iron-containing alcohol dehydrogenase [Bacteroidales bacterium]